MPETGSEGLTRRAWGTLLVLCGAFFLDSRDVSMVGVALPSIRSDLHMSTSSLQWVVSAYVLGYGGFLLLGGRAADLLGRRRMFLVSLAVFVVGSGLGGLASGATMLIATRFVKGISAAFTAPAGLSIITTSFPEGPARNKALSIYTATGATGFSLGLVIGGLLTEAGGRWVFFLPTVVALVALLAASGLRPGVPPPPPPVPGGLGPPGDRAGRRAWCSPRLAPLVGRFGVNRLILVGMTLLVPAYALFLRVGLHSGYAGAMLPTFLIAGLGFGLAFGPLNIAATNGIAPHEQGLAGGLLNTSFQFGGALFLARATAVDSPNVGPRGT